jgi:hypothetical protein
MVFALTITWLITPDPPALPLPFDAMAIRILKQLLPNGA